ncbi:MAG: hypothetical protein A2Y10_10445 [Planctomycetes bacterium GWF2_41_51]|nr:MAG: hypothetical protein A2Y10_10445 [Planctomycetes bacterium GWF2_41_51]HBG27639.1 hypothetical protein [Phycisphaerales bacterium]
MGYTQYWKRIEKFDKQQFEKVTKDFKEVLKHLSPFVPLAGGMGKGEPEISSKRIWFNGVENCGHTDRDLGITWPDKNAHGIAFVVERYEEIPTETLITLLCGQQQELAVNDSDVSGTWFAGLKLKHRSCGGDCSHETFSLPLQIKKDDWQKPIGEIRYYDHEGKPVYNDPKDVGRYFEFCKTAYKPYDLAVIICLIIAKHYLKEDILISSDGGIDTWRDGMLICQKILGYGLDFSLED